MRDHERTGEPAVERVVRRNGRRLHTRHRHYALDQRTIESLDRRRRRHGVVLNRIAALRQLQLRLERARHIEPRRRRQQIPEASNQQPGSCHQHNGERHFGDYKERAQAARLGSTRDAVFRLEQRRDGRALGLHDRNEAEYECNERRASEGDEHRPHVDPDGGDARDLCRGSQDERTKHDEGEDERYHRACARKNDVLGDELPREAAGLGTECRTHRHFAQPPRPTCQQQVGHVRARHDQNQRHGPHQHEQGRLDRSEHHLAE